MSAAKKDALKDSSYYLNDECMKPLKVSSKDFKAFDKELQRIKNPMFNKGETIALSDLNSIQGGDRRTAAHLNTPGPDDMFFPHQTTIEKDESSDIPKAKNSEVSSS